LTQINLNSSEAMAELISDNERGYPGMKVDFKLLKGGQFGSMGPLMISWNFAQKPMEW
jgi:hypothetical protein